MECGETLAATSTGAPAILVVDDSRDNCNILQRLLEVRGYRVRTATGGIPALEAVENAPPDLILLDIGMPDMDGYRVCMRLKENERLREIPVLFLSAFDDADDKVRAFQSGGVDYVTKPFQYEEVFSRIETHLKIRRLQVQLETHNRDLEKLVAEQVQEISESQLATIFALAKLAESRDEDTGAHLERVQTLCRLLAARLAEEPRFKDHIGQAYILNIHHASPLHDIGKVGIPDGILLKPGRLTPEEFEAMKAHTTLGAETLAAVRQTYPKNSLLGMGIAIAKSHHERWDGKGYPEGLAGGDIPLSARIMAVADVYDALRSKRCYKPSFSHEKSLAILLEGRGTAFDPTVVDAFLELAPQCGDMLDAIGY